MIGESSLASPVFDSYGEAVGAIGVVIPSGGDLERHEARDAGPRDARGRSPASWARTPGPRAADKSIIRGVR